MRGSFLPLFLLAGLAVSAGCSDSTSEATLPECTGTVAPTIGAGLTPVIRWTPACRLFLVLVEDPTGGTDQWGVLSDSTNGIAPPVTYGTLPAGATKELTPPNNLQTGHAYRLDVLRFTGPGHEDGVLAGQVTFTP